MGNKRDTLEKYNGDVKWSELSDEEQGYFGSKDVFRKRKDRYNDNNDDVLDTSVGVPDPQDHLADYTSLLDIIEGYSTADREDRQLFEGQQNDKDRLNAVAIANINTASNEAVAGIYAGADIFGSQVTLSGYNLLDARERDLTEYTTKVEDARLRDFKDKDIAYGLNLQKIINSGLADVATIQGQYSVSGIATRGRFDKEIQKIRTAGDQDIARTNMYGQMMAGFWNSIG
tara:strand:+ start:300 stop:989 length:690 start_codon:yes stop_codon:yes gene_type:complete